ncbi:ATP-binding cassette domain-containing protein, partial [Streptococcus oralis]
DDYLDRLGFGQEDRHRIIKGYSSGMKSKLAILCLLISKPKIILLDEPLTAIDVISSLEIKRLLLDLGKDHIMIMSTHMIQLAKDICDDIVLLHQGQLRH